MEKAYDVKDLVKRLKDNGLEVAEDMALVLVSQSISWLRESAIMSENKIDDMIASFYGLAEDKLKELADKIDGKEG